jgi:hypothetical protein
MIDHNTLVIISVVVLRWITGDKITSWLRVSQKQSKRKGRKETYLRLGDSKREEVRSTLDPNKNDTLHLSQGQTSTHKLALHSHRKMTSLVSGTALITSKRQCRLDFASSGWFLITGCQERMAGRSPSVLSQYFRRPATDFLKSSDFTNKLDYRSSSAHLSINRLYIPKR